MIKIIDESMNNEEIEYVFKIFDVNDDKSISLEEFETYLKWKVFYRKLKSIFWNKKIFFFNFFKFRKKKKIPKHFFLWLFLLKKNKKK